MHPVVKAWRVADARQARGMIHSLHSAASPRLNLLLILSPSSLLCSPCSILSRLLGTNKHDCSTRSVESRMSRGKPSGAGAFRLIAHAYRLTSFTPPCCSCVDRLCSLALSLSWLSLAC